MKALSEFMADTWRAFAGLGLAMAITWALTPVVGELARRMGALDFAVAGVFVCIGTHNGNPGHVRVHILVRVRRYGSA